MNNKLKDDIANYITEKRYLHTLSVERECENLSQIYCLDHVNAERLSAAALLHDITKDKKPEEQILLCERYNIPVSEEDKLSPKTFHAKTGASFAKEYFPSVTDEIVLSCIRWHTTGRAAMTLPEKLLYLADYIEETRNFTDCIELRRYFYSGVYISDKIKFLNETLVLSFDMTIRNLLDDGSIINSETVNSRNYLLTGALNE